MTRLSLMTAIKSPKLPRKSKPAKSFITTSTKDSSPLDDFYFKPKRKQINWRLLSTVNIDDIVRQNKVEVLHSMIENVTFCDIQDKGSRSFIRFGRFRSKRGQTVSTFSNDY